MVASLTLVDLIERDKSDHVEESEPEFRELYDLLAREAFGMAALKVVCAAFGDRYEPAGVLKRWRGVHVGPELLVRKIFFKLVRPWFTAEEMQIVFGFEARQLQRDILELERWAKLEPALAELVDGLADMVDGVPVVVLGRKAGMAAARKQYALWCEARRERRVADKAETAERKRLITAENAPAVAMLAMGTPLGEVIRLTKMRAGEVADLYLGLERAGSLNKILAQARALKAAP